MSSLVFRITGDPTSAKGAIASVSSSLDGMGRKAQSVSQQMASLGSSLTIGLTLPVVAAGTAFVKAAADMEKLNKGLASIMGSATAGAAEMKKLQDAAKMPGLGLEGAVQGSIRLQVLGKTADESRKIMAELGNAIALVGGGKDDFAEVTRQLGQMLSVGKVTKENLDTITERIPQISKIMIDTWGPQSVGDPAKFFEKAGISSQKFWEIIISKLGESARAGDTFANKMGNLEEAIKMASARIGDKMLPALEKLLPKLEGLAIGAADAVEGFLAMPEPIKNAAIALGLLAVASGPVLSGIGGIQKAIGLLPAGTAAAAVAMGGLFGAVAIASIAQTMTAIDQLKAKTKDYYDFLERMKSGGKEDVIKGQEKAALGGVRVRESFLVQEINAAEKFKINLKGLATELGFFGGEVKKVEKPIKAVGEALKATNKIVVDSIAGLDAKGGLSKTSLLYVEILERTKTAVGKVKDAMYEYYTMGTIVGGQLDTHRSSIQGLAFDYGLLGPAIQTAIHGMNMLSNLRPPQIDITNDNLRRGSVFETDDILSRGGGSSSRQQSSRVDQFEADLARIKQLNAEGKATGNDVIQAQQNLKKAMEDVGAAAKTSGSAQSKALQQVSTIITDLSRGLARNIIDWKGWRETGVGAVKNLAEAVTRSLIEGVLAKLSTKLIEVSGLMSAIFKGATGVASSAAPAIGAAAGLAVPTIGAAVGLGGQIGAGAAVPAAGGISGALGGLTSIVGAVASVGSLISGIVGNVQNMAMNKSLDLIGHEVRYSQIHLLHTLNRANEFWPYMKLSWESLLRMEGKGAGAGGTVINNNINGGFFVGNNAIDELLDMLTRRLKQQMV